MTRAVAIDFDAVLGDTKPLWDAWVADAERRYRVELGAAEEAVLDERLGNWRVLVERFAEDHAPVYLRPRPEANAAVRRLAAAGVRTGTFTETPEPLARVAAAHLGIARNLDVLEAGPRALDHLLERFGDSTLVARSLDALLDAATSPSA
jgi:phosphoglycolate phosphatase-like HAD superfamily hydrolase